MSSKLLKRLKFGVLAGLFALTQALVPAQAALATPSGGGAGQTGTPQPVWCQHTSVWEAQLGDAGSDNNKNRFPLKSLPAGAPADMYIDEGTGQVYTPNGSFDALKTALNAQCVEQQEPTDPEDDESEEPVNYCNPKPSVGSVADHLPAGEDCVTYVVEATECGLFATVTNKTQFEGWDVAWSEGQEDVAPEFHYSNALSTDRANPTTFTEDYNGGSVTIHYWLTGPESDYIEGRTHIPNYWDGTYGTIVVNTDCKDDEPEVPVLGTDTDEPRKAPQADVPAVLPQTGATASSNSNPLLILLAGALAYGVLYFAQPRRSAEQI